MIVKKTCCIYCGLPVELEEYEYNTYHGGMKIKCKGTKITKHICSKSKIDYDDDYFDSLADKHEASQNEQ